jgi:hypothetical protein
MQESAVFGYSRGDYNGFPGLGQAIARRIGYRVDASSEMLVNGCKEACSIDFGGLAAHC